MSGNKILMTALLGAAALAVFGIVQAIHTKPGGHGVATNATVPSLEAPAGDPNFVIRFVKDPEQAPALETRDITGKPLSKANWAGKVVLVNFWATWCPPCREEIPELIELQKLYGDRLEIIGISEDDDPPEDEQ